MDFVCGQKRSDTMCEHVHDSVYVYTRKAFRLLATGSLGLKQPVHSRVSSLQKQVGCFNLGVVTLVADKLETERFTLVWKTHWIRQPKK